MLNALTQSKCSKLCQPNMLEPKREATPKQEVPLMQEGATNVGRCYEAGSNTKPSMFTAGLEKQ